MRRQSAQTGSNFTKWQPAPGAVEFERKRRWHLRIHRAQLIFDVAVVVGLLALALAPRA